MFSKGSPSPHGRRSGPPKANAAIAGAALAVLAALTAGAGAAHANLIVNGNFSANASSYTAFPGYSVSPNPAAPTGWTLGAPQNAGVNGPDTGFYAASGSPFAPSSTSGVGDFAFMQGGQMYQTVATTAGQAYTLTYDAAARSGTPSALETIAFNAVASAAIVSQAPSISESNFAAFTLNFTAASSSTQIVFADTGGTPDVSNVSLTEAAVPEPASLGLLAVGGLGLSLIGRRRGIRGGA